MSVSAGKIRFAPIEGWTPPEHGTCALLDHLIGGCNAFLATHDQSSRRTLKLKSLAAAMMVATTASWYWPGSGCPCLAKASMAIWKTLKASFSLITLRPTRRRKSETAIKLDAIPAVTITSPGKSDGFLGLMAHLCNGFAEAIEEEPSAQVDVSAAQAPSGAAGVVSERSGAGGASPAPAPSPLPSAAE